MGTLPMHLAAAVCARGARFLALELELPPDFRGRPLSADDMEHLGARLVEYRVERLGEAGEAA
jgi:CRISPR-associated protein Csx16